MNIYIIQLLVNSSIIMSWIFIPNFALELGASNFEIGLIGSIYGFSVFISSYIFGIASDVFGRKLFLRLGMALCFISYFMQIYIDNVTSLIVIRVLAGLAVGVYTPSLMAYVYESGHKMGKFSSVGSLGWTIGSIMAGAITIIHDLFLLSSFFFLIAFVVALKSSFGKKEPLSVSMFPVKIIKKNFDIYMAYFLRHTGAGALWTIFPVFLVEIGASRSQVGLIYLINFSFQVIIMRYLDAVNNIKLIRAGLIISSIVFFSYYFVTDYRQVLPIQIILALSWSCLYVGSISFLAERNIERATSLGMLTSIISLSGVFGPFLCGVISQIWDYRAVMIFSTVMSAAGLSIMHRSKLS